MRKIFTTLLTACALTVWAQKPTLSPAPQSITWGDELTIAPTAITKGIVGDEAVAAYVSKVPEKAEGYYLSMDADGIVLVGRDQRGLFYAEKTLSQLLGEDRANAGHDTQLYAAEVTDYPDVADRGVVEGFYGNPWSHADRLRMFEFLADNKMNMYIYGPKNDPYHWGQWATLYPDTELNQLAELVTKAAEEQVKFVWAVHPSESLNDSQMEQLRVKLEQLYSIGVRTFGLFFDDAGGNATMHSLIINTMTEKFVKVHDDVEPIITCPVYYCDSFGGKDYQLEMANATKDNDVKIMWTGSGIMDMNLGTSCKNFMNRNGVKPFVWHNWPCNDYSRAHLFLGKSDGMDSSLKDYISGYTSNPMEYAEASKVGVYSMADYCWNMAAYNADKSWQQAWQYLYPNSTQAFGLFCQNSVETGSSRLVRTGEAEYFNAALNSGTSEATLYQQIVDAAGTLLADETDPYLLAELRPFFQAFLYVGQRGLLVDDMSTALEDQKPEDFIEAYQQYKQLIEQAEALETHSWFGGSGFICPTIATKVVGPYIEARTATLVAAFKEAGYQAPEGLFEPQVIENGDYYIMYDGRYLTNDNPGADNTGDRPSFSTTTLGATNPLTQQWHIAIDPETKRYKITNLADGRYVNENGKFWADKTVNAYSAVWNSYEIYRRNGKHAIQNGGSAGTNFWTVNATNIEKGTSTSIVAGNFIFDIVPVGATVEYPQIESGTRHYIAYGNKLLTFVSGLGYPVFTDPAASSTTQLWYITEEADQNGRYRINRLSKTPASGNYINEYGNIGTNQYYNNWNSYTLLERDGLWSMQNGGDAGTDYWTIEDDGNGRLRIKGKNSGAALNNSYLFEIGTDWDAFKARITAIEQPQQDSHQAATQQPSIYTITGQPVTQPTHGLYIINGRKVVR